MVPSILAPHFRPGKQFVLTWSIPEAFGGMTGALLHRSRAFVRLTSHPVDILTLDDRSDYAELVERLRGAGEIIDGIRVVNIWDWLREHDETVDALAGGAPKVAHTHEPIGDAADLTEHAGAGAVLIRELRSGNEKDVIAIDRFRADGTLLVTDRRDSATHERSVVLYDRRGNPVRSWGSAWGVYRYWLDRIIDGQESFVIVDSKTAARFARTYRRRNVVMMHVLHGSHRTADGSDLSASRRSVLENLGDFDSVIVLTERQRDDLFRDLGRHENVTVISNGFNSATERAEKTGDGRMRGSGLMLASLIVRKRVSHAVKAIARASEFVDVSLDVFGEGERRLLLEQTIRSLGMTGRVRLRGHDGAARSAFRTADFMLLTSKAEGLPLALIEGMAAGCIPIAYDIPYGPSDVISDGRNGFLVPPGDIDALARRIVDLQRMPPDAVDAMRRRAQATAERFDDRAVTRAWGREMERAYERKHAASGPESAVRRLRHLGGRTKRRITRLSGRYDASGS